MRDVAQGQISPAKNRRSSIAALTIVVMVACCAWLEHELILQHVAASCGISDELRQADAAWYWGILSHPKSPFGFDIRYATIERHHPDAPRGAYLPHALRSLKSPV